MFSGLPVRSTASPACQRSIRSAAGPRPSMGLLKTRIVTSLAFCKWHYEMMSPTRRKPAATTVLFQELRWHCDVCRELDGRTHKLAAFIRQQLPGVEPLYGQLKSPIPTFVDPADGHETLMATCTVCLDLGRRFTPQVRWDRVKGTLDDMELAGARRRIVYWR